MKNSSIKKNAILNVIYTLSNIIFPLVTYPYVLRIISVSNMGRINFFTNLANYIIMLGSLGLSTYGIRATAKVRDDRDKLNKVTKQLFVINLFVILCLSICLIVSSLFISKFKDSFELLLINLVYILSSPFSMNWLYSGLEKYSFITKRSIIIKFISIITIFVLVKNESDFLIYALITVASYLVTYSINYIYSKKFVSFRGVSIKGIRAHFKPMLLLFVSILAINVYTHLDTVMLGFISGDEEVGLYTVAVYIKTALLTLINAISAVLLPRVSYYFGNGKLNELNKILKKSIVTIIMISLPFTSFFLITSYACVLVLGGEQYYNAGACMMIIMPILLISSISNITGNQILIPQGKDSFFMKAVVCGALLDVILNFALMPKYGCVGAAVATLCAEVVQLSIQMFYARDSFISNINWKSIKKIIISTFIATLITVFAYRLLNYSSIINIIICFIIFFGLYLISLLFLKEEVSSSYINGLLFKLKERKN